MKELVAIVESICEHGLREINALERRIVTSEDDADAMLWDQARQVVAQLDAGLTQRELAAQWINARTGEPYSQMHVSLTARLYREKHAFQLRPRFRDAYNEIAHGTSNKVNRLLHQTRTIEWYTPEPIVAAVRDVLGAIDLDPASREAANEIVKAARIYTVDDDGLENPWQGRVFLNPPYKQPEIRRFSEKFAAHARAGDIEGIALVNNATETGWFSTLAGVATAFCFPSFRFHYWQPDRDDTGSALQGQVIVYTGPNREAFCRRFQDLGLVLVRP